MSSNACSFVMGTTYFGKLARLALSHLLPPPEDGDLPMDGGGETDEMDPALEPLPRLRLPPRALPEFEGVPPPLLLRSGE